MAHKEGNNGNPNVDITITIADGSAKPDPAPISQSNHEVAHWISDTPGEDFLVVFEGDSPFKEWHYDGTHATSSAAGGTIGTTYKYTVYTKNGSVKNDPGIIIHP